MGEETLKLCGAETRTQKPQRKKMEHREVKNNFGRGLSVHVVSTYPDLLWEKLRICIHRDYTQAQAEKCYFESGEGEGKLEDTSRRTLLIEAEK